jgi:hypothetical protein
VARAKYLDRVLVPDRPAQHRIFQLDLIALAEDHATDGGGSPGQEDEAVARHPVAIEQVEPGVSAQQLGQCGLLVNPALAERGGAAPEDKPVPVGSALV